MNLYDKDRLMNPVLFKIYYFIYKNLLWVLLLGFLLMLFGYMGTVIHNQQVQLDYSKSVEAAMNLKISGVENILSQKENELGQQTTKVRAIVSEKENLETLIRAQDKYLTARLEEIDVKVKNIQSVTSLNVKTSGEFQTITKDSIVEKIVIKYVGDSLRKDTVKHFYKVINYKEPSGWFTMTGSIKGDTVKFVPTFYEEYDVVIHDEKKPKKHWLDLFPGKHTVGTVHTRNPFTRTNTVKVITQKKVKRKMFGIF